MKIIILSLNVVTKGGTERAISNLANYLCPGNEIYILSLCSNDTEKSFYNFENCINIIHGKYEYIPSGIFAKLKWNIKILLYIKSIMREIRPDCILGTGHNTNVFLPFLKAKCNKTIACEHLVTTSLPFSSRIIMKLLYPKIDSLVVLSESLKKQLVSFNNNIFIIPNMLKCNQSEVMSIKRKKQIIMVGRFSYEKGYDRLIDIAKKMKMEYPNWNISIYGDGPLFFEIKKLIEDNDLNDYISLEGSVLDIHIEYLKSSIFLMLSRFEAFPMAILEAKYSGLPIVAFDAPLGARELVKNGIDGFLVENGNSKEIVNKLSILIEDHELRKEFSLNAKKDSLSYMETIVGKKWLDLFHHLNNN